MPQQLDSETTIPLSAGFLLLPVRRISKIHHHRGFRDRHAPHQGAQRGAGEGASVFMQTGRQL